MLALLTACPGEPTIVPDKASFNGVTQLDTVAGKAELSVSALKDETVLTRGTITNASATVTSTSLQAQQTFTVRAEVCGNIIPKGETITGLLTLDSTGSMGSNDPTKLRAVAAKDFVVRMSGQDRAAVASFDTSTAPTAPYTDLTIWQNFSSDKPLLETAIDKATFDRGDTNVWDAGIDSVALLKTTSGENKIVVLLTDGEDNRSSNDPEDVIESANQETTSIYTIGLGRSINARELLEIASATGGTFNQVNEADDLIGLYDSIFNATRASGCIEITFQPLPSPGAVLSGNLTFTVNGANLTTAYTVRFPD